jgi:hypothetical protein
MSDYEVEGDMAGAQSEEGVMFEELHVEVTS